MIQENQNEWATPTLKEAPFWRNGMTPEEYEVEREYWYRNHDEIINGTYVPLWKQAQNNEK